MNRTESLPLQLAGVAVVQAHDQEASQEQQLWDRERRGWNGKEVVGVQPIDLSTNNPDKTNTSEE